MGSRGPAKLPTALKILRGTDRADRAPKTELKNGFNEPPPPPGRFDRDEQRIWKILTESTVKLGILYEIHLPELEYITELLARSRKLIAISKRKKEPILYIRNGKDGSPASWTVNPYTSQADKCRREAFKLLRAYGGAPSALEELSIKEADTNVDDWSR